LGFISFQMAIRSIIKRTFLILLIILVSVAIYFSVGSEVTRNLDSYIYELPFKQGTSHRVVQGYGGRFSHKNKACLDFEMPVGTPVYAAREGEVYRFKDDSNEGGILPKYEKRANYIIIRHDDGSFACYWHLKQYGVMVKKGRVTKGQLIGFSGSTGFVLRPHLHFSVKKQLSYEMDAFVRTKFRTSDGVKMLESGHSYKKPDNPEQVN
jgi:murein DD-endopeptidase MepM/ murein hydrolase activator NlpD